MSSKTLNKIFNLENVPIYQISLTPAPIFLPYSHGDFLQKGQTRAGLVSSWLMRKIDQKNPHSDKTDPALMLFGAI